jgi:hypothetical protein
MRCRFGNRRYSRLGGLRYELDRLNSVAAELSFSVLFEIDIRGGDEPREI